MKHGKCTAYATQLLGPLALIGLILIGSGLPTPSHAESKRIEVYPLSQHYVDTRAGDTLSGIVARLLPDNAQLQQQLLTDIHKRNPEAFIGNNPNRLRANTRLWLPNQLNNADTTDNTENYRVESFSWGNIKRPK